MNGRIALLVGAFGLLSLVGSEVAEAGGRGRVRFGGGGGVHVRIGGGHARAAGRIGGSVRWSSAPRRSYQPRGWSVGGRIRVHVGHQPRVRYYPRPYYYGPAYVPSYYGGYYGASYYPVAPAAAPGIVTVLPDRQELPKFGIGLFAGGVAVEDVSESSDLGVLGRLRLGHGGLLVEGELGKTSYESDLRVDRRLGGALVYEFGARNRLAPFVLAGIGVQQADVAGEFTTTQNFAEVGLGVRYALTPKFHIAFDIRAGSRDTMSNDASPPPEPGKIGTTARSISPPSSTAADDNEGYSRARLSAILYF